MAKEMSRKARMAAQATERAALIAALRLPPEPTDGGAAERYAATTGDLIRWLRQDIADEARIAHVALSSTDVTGWAAALEAAGQADLARKARLVGYDVATAA